MIEFTSLIEITPFDGLIRRCIEDVVIKFPSAINIKIDITDNSIANLNAREFFDHDHFKIFSSIMSTGQQEWLYLLHPHPKIAFWNSDNSSIQNIHEQNYMDSAMFFLFEDLCFPFGSLNSAPK